MIVNAHRHDRDQSDNGPDGKIDAAGDDDHEHPERNDAGNRAFVNEHPNVADAEKRRELAVDAYENGKNHKDAGEADEPVRKGRARFEGLARLDCS